MTLELLQADALREALQQGRRALAEKEVDTGRLRAAVQAIHAELDAIIEVLKEEVRRATVALRAADGPRPSWA